MVFDDFINAVIAITKGYDPYSSLNKMLGNSSRGKHRILSSALIAHEVEAYHVRFVEWVALKVMANTVEFDETNDEGIKFICYSFFDADELNSVPLPSCNTPFWLSSTTTVCGNCIDDNADCNGSQAGAKAETNYYFYVEDLSKYAVIKMRY